RIPKATVTRVNEKGEQVTEVVDRYSSIVEDYKSPSKPFPESNRVLTTVGRLMFNEIVRVGMPFYNCNLPKKGCARVIDDAYRLQGRPATIELLDLMKE